MALTAVDLRLPTDGTGSPGGTIAARLTFPSTIADYRYQDGAPVAVYLTGGVTPGSLPAGQKIAQQGFVMVTFIYPGGSAGGFSSDGVYDNRGDSCQRALRDVIRFAAGQGSDSLGRTIDDIVPGPVHTDMVVFTPFSNGLIGLVTLDRYGSEIPVTPFQVGWENPTSGQIVTGDLGAVGNDCDGSVDGDGNGLPGDDGKNPWYDPATGYGPTTFIVDFSRLEFDPLAGVTLTDPTGRCAPVGVNGIVFHDGRTNGRIDYRTGQVGCTDYDGDGIIERTEDFKLGGWITFNQACVPKVYYSAEVTRALRDFGVFLPGSWPAWIATPDEADLYWPLRDAMVHWDGIARKFPDYRAMTVFAKQDHVQAQDDHPHVRQVLDGMTARGLWYRLQADRAYYLAVNGTVPAGYVELPANSPVPMGQMKSRAEPRGTASNDMAAAGVSEMADRVHSGCWWPDLEATLRPAGSPSPGVGELRFAPDKTTLLWSAAVNAFCYDLLGGDAASLSDEGTRIALGGARCLEEDSADTIGTDAAVPPAGSAFYYVVKPNGPHGSYGTGSNGHPRYDASGACRY